LIEYTLLLAFVCRASASVVYQRGRRVGGIWRATNSQLAVAQYVSQLRFALRRFSSKPIFRVLGLRSGI